MSARRTPVPARQERLRFGPPSPAPRRPATTVRPAARPVRDAGCDAATTATELARPRALAREGRTLEDLVLGAWEDLLAHPTTACPVCSEVMERTGPAMGGACTSCHTHLA